MSPKSKPDLFEVSNMDQLTEQRFFKMLDNIVDKLSGIEEKQSNSSQLLQRLDERLSSHSEALSRYGKRLDSHEERIRDSEMWQANFGDKAALERLIKHIQTDIESVKENISELKQTKTEIHELRTELKEVREKAEEIENNSLVNKGHKDIVKEILKWTSGILAALIVYMVNKGQ